VDGLLIDRGFHMAFSSTLHPLRLDPNGTIPPFLKKVKEIVDQPRPPEMLAGCSDCESLDRLIQFATS
jgi:hypothetical protein